MVDIPIVGLVEIVLGSSLLGIFAKGFFDKRKKSAETKKLKLEADKLLLEENFKITEFYKNQLDDLIVKYNHIEEQLIVEKEARKNCIERLDKLEIQYQELLKKVEEKL